jgi:hypothetical protein
MTVSLFPLRNRIDDLEIRYGVSTLQPGELSNFLQKVGYDLSKLIAELRTFSANQTVKMTHQQLNEIISKMDRSNQKDVNCITDAVTGQEPKMSDTLAEKASVHSLRFRYIFMRYADTKEVKTMIKEVEKRFEGDVDAFCREVGYLFIKLSTVGVHLRPATIDGEPVTVSLMRSGLIAHGIADSNSLNTVDVLYSTCVNSC